MQLNYPNHHLFPPLSCLSVKKKKKKNLLKQTLALEQNYAMEENVGVWPAREPSAGLPNFSRAETFLGLSAEVPQHGVWLKLECPNCTLLHLLCPNATILYSAC